MKGFITSLIIFLTLITLLVVYSFYINHTFSAFSREINKISALITKENYDEAEKASEKLNKCLNEKSGILYFVTDRSPIDTSLTECKKMLSFISTKDKSEALACAYGIDVLLKKTKEKSLLLCF